MGRALGGRRSLRVSPGIFDVPAIRAEDGVWTRKIALNLPSAIYFLFTPIRHDDIIHGHRKKEDVLT